MHEQVSGWGLEHEVHPHNTFGISTDEPPKTTASPCGRGLLPEAPSWCLSQVKCLILLQLQVLLPEAQQQEKNNHATQYQNQ